MNIEKIIHAKEFEVEKEYIAHEIDKNLTEKLDAYLRKYPETAEARLEITLTRWKHETFDGKISLWANGETYRSNREEFKKLSDLIDHLFTHIKEQLSK